MNTIRTFTRTSKRLPIKADGNCFYNAVLTALSTHPLFESGQLSENVVDYLDLNVPVLTVDALKRCIIQSRSWSDRMLGMFRTWTSMDREQQSELRDQYAEQVPAFVAYVSTSVDSTGVKTSGGCAHPTTTTSTRRFAPRQPHHGRRTTGGASWKAHGSPSSLTRKYLQHMSSSVMENGSFATENEVVVLTELLDAKCDVVLHIHMDQVSVGEIPFGTRLKPHIHILWHGMHYDTAV